MTDIFWELLSIKEPQTLQNRETTVQSYRKISNHNTTTIPGIEFVLFNCTGEMGMDDFGYLKSSLYIISIRNATNLRKKIMAYVRLELNLPLPYTSF